VTEEIAAPFAGGESAFAALTEEWISRWEAEAAARGLDRHSGLFWRPAWEWIAEQGRQ